VLFPPWFPLFGCASTAETSTRPSGSLRMTKSADGFRLMRSFAMPTSKTALPFSEPLDQSARPFPSRNNLTFATFGHNFIDAIASLHCTSGALHFGFSELHWRSHFIHLQGSATGCPRPVLSRPRSRSGRPPAPQGRWPPPRPGNGRRKTGNRR